jgi:ribonuclease Z
MGGSVNEKGVTVMINEVASSKFAARKFVYCADTRINECYQPYVFKADLLLHESTFMDSEREQAYSRYHATAGQVANLAKSNEVQKLILTHFSARYKDLSPFIQEAESIMPNVHLAEPGKRFNVPPRSLNF